MQAQELNQMLDVQDVLEAWAEAEMIVSVEATEAGVVILEITPLMVDAMIGTTIMDHLETALAMADLTDLVLEVVEDIVEVQEEEVLEAAEAGVEIVEVVWEWKLHGLVVKKKKKTFKNTTTTLFS